MAKGFEALLERMQELRDLSGIIGLLTWIYLSAYVFIFGAELNSEIEHQTAIDSTTGTPEPLGERGAWAADNVADSDEVEDRPEEVREGEKLTGASPDLPGETKGADGDDQPNGKRR